MSDDERSAAYKALIVRTAALFAKVRSDILKARELPADEDLARIIAEPDELAAMATAWCREEMRAVDQLAAVVVLLTPQQGFSITLQEVPADTVQQMILAGALAALLRTSPVGAYWIASEAWIAVEDSRNPTGLLPAQREDKREGVLISLATPTAHRLAHLITQRDDDGHVTELSDDPAEIPRLSQDILMTQNLFLQVAPPSRYDA